MADKDVPYHAPWAAGLQHRPDPNRVNATQIRSTPAGNFLAPPAAAPPPAHTQTAEPSYYNLSMLKAPVWKWEIASYFFLGGMSAGAYLLSRVADRAGGGKYRDLVKAGASVAMLGLLPSPPLLIADLGDPKRFHHMLRIWKPSSPMNFGSWALSAYGGMVTFEVVRQYLTERGSRIGAIERNKLFKLMNNGTLLLMHDAAGIPFALMVASYTGVLLSSTANPLWCKNPWLSPLFTASAISTGAEAAALAIDATTKETSQESPSLSVLRKIDTAAHVVEGVAMAGFLRHAGEKAKPLRTGSMAAQHQFTIWGIIAAEVLKLLPLRGQLRRAARLLGAALGLSAGFAMRWSMIYGGVEAAKDPRLSRLVGEEKEDESFRSEREASIRAPNPKRAQIRG